MSRDQSTHNVCLAYCIPQNSIYIKLSREQKPNSHCCSSLEVWYKTKKQVVTLLRKMQDTSPSIRELKNVMEYEEN